MFKFIVQYRLEQLVKKYFRTHKDVRLVVVAGSVGKTTTKFAIAEVLSQKFRVRFQEGNYNSEMSVPVSLLGVEYPSDIRSVSQWMKVIKAMKTKISQPSDIDIIVQELGTDRIGQIPHFGKYLKPDIAVITAISPEHMEYFHDMQNVAKEELSVAEYSKQALINGDDIDPKYQLMINNPLVSTYGLASSNHYFFSLDEFNLDKGYKGAVEGVEISGNIPTDLMVFGAHSIRTVVAAAAVGIKFGMSPDDISKGMTRVKPVPGRMNVLPGINGIKIIDDSYNSSPLSVKLALQTLYNLTGDSKVAVLGDMNELGASSEQEHLNVGKLCNPKNLKMLVTVGKNAQELIATTAAANGCKVKSFKTSKEAGSFLVSNLPHNSIVLFKGSEGGIYLEEAIKPILLHSSLDSQLVRQSSVWLERKEKFFADA